MRTYVLGSVNIDRVYRVRRIAAPGATVNASSFELFPGGKGYNQTIALARAGANVCLVGAIGADGSWLLGDLRSAGADVSRVATTRAPTGHAVVQVDDAGENGIVVSAGANALVTVPMLEAGLSFSHAGDFFLAQNETSCVAEGLTLAKRKGLVTVLNPSPYDERVAALPLDLVDVFVVNETEGAALSGASASTDPRDMLALLRARFPEAGFVLTLGGRGCAVFDRSASAPEFLPAFGVEAVDTTAAGDTFVGYWLAAVSRGVSPSASARRASAAAALAVTRRGAAPSIPSASEVDDFLAKRQAR